MLSGPGALPRDTLGSSGHTKTWNWPVFKGFERHVRVPYLPSLPSLLALSSSLLSGQRRQGRRSSAAGPHDLQRLRTRSCQHRVLFFGLTVCGKSRRIHCRWPARQNINALKCFSGFRKAIAWPWAYHSSGSGRRDCGSPLPIFAAAAGTPCSARVSPVRDRRPEDGYRGDAQCHLIPPMQAP